MAKNIVLFLLVILGCFGVNCAMQGRVLQWDSSINATSIAKELVVDLGFNASNVSFFNQSSESLQIVHEYIACQLFLLSKQVREKDMCGDSKRFHANIVRLRKLDALVCYCIKRLQHDE